MALKEKGMIFLIGNGLDDTVYQFHKGTLKLLRETVTGFWRHGAAPLHPSSQVILGSVVKIN